MTSILKVDSIQNAAGTAAMTIDSSGKVTGSVNDSRQCAMGFMRTSSVSGDQNPVSGFVNMATQLSSDSAGEITRGGSVSHSSGIFSVPFTGLWQVEYFITLNSSASDATIQVNIDTTQDNSSYSSLIQAKESVPASGNKSHMSMKAFWKVTNTSNDKLKFVHASFASHSAEGDTSVALTYCLFTWLGDAD